MRLFEVFLPPHLARLPQSGGAGRAGAGDQMPKSGRDLRGDGLVVHGTGGGDDQLVGAVMLGHEAGQVGTGEGAHALGRAQELKSRGFLSQAALDTALANCGVRFTRIGRIQAGDPGIDYVQDEQPVELHLKGWDHFA